MGIVKLINTLEVNLFIDSISRNVAPKGQIMLPDGVVDSDPQIAQCIASGILKSTGEETAPKKVDPSTLETEVKLDPVPVLTSKVDAEQDEPSENATVATGVDGGVAEVKPTRSAEIPLPSWLNQDQLRRSEAASREYDLREGTVEELRVTDAGVEKTVGGKTELISKDGVTVREGTDPLDAMPEPVKIEKIKRTDDGENDPLIADEHTVEDYSTAFVDESGNKPDPGYGKAFVD